MYSNERAARARAWPTQYTKYVLFLCVARKWNSKCESNATCLANPIGNVAA